MKVIKKALKIYWKATIWALAIVGSGLYLDRAIKENPDDCGISVMQKCCNEAVNAWANWIRNFGMFLLYLIEGVYK